MDWSGSSEQMMAQGITTLGRSASIGTFPSALWEVVSLPGCSEGEVRKQLEGLRPEDLNQRHPEWGLTVLIAATTTGRVDCIRLLLRAGANPDVTDGGSGRTALAWAAWMGKHDVVLVLLKEGVGLDIVDHKGRTALMNAAAMGHKDVVRSLLRAGADARVQNAAGQTVLVMTEDEDMRAIIREALEGFLPVHSATIGRKSTPPPVPSPTAGDVKEHGRKASSAFRSESRDEPLLLVLDEDEVEISISVSKAPAPVTLAPSDVIKTLSGTPGATTEIDLSSPMLADGQAAGAGSKSSRKVHTVGGAAPYSPSAWKHLEPKRRGRGSSGFFPAALPTMASMPKLPTFKSPDMPPLPEWAKNMQASLPSMPQMPQMPPVMERIKRALAARSHDSVNNNRNLWNADAEEPLFDDGQY